MAGRMLMPYTLDEVITLANEDFKGQRASVDMAFQIPSGMTPVLLQFKDNVVVSVDAVQPASEETEDALSGGGSPQVEGGGRPQRPADPNS